MRIPEYDDIVSAHERISAFVHRTPVLTCKSIDEMLGVSLFFKCENFQKVGAFKFRGATNAVLSLSEEAAARGVATHSSGNHAAALALAAKQRGIKAYIVMPDNSPEVKKKAVKGYGGIITFCKPTLQAREEALVEVVEKTGATVVHPYNQFEVICGQGTAVKELLEDCDELDVVMTPVGGGGLLSGTATFVKHLYPEVKVWAGEPLMANDAWQSFNEGRLIPVVNPNTIADGLRTSLGDLSYAIIRDKVDRIFTVSEKSIVKAMRMMWERMKIIVEPSSAVPLAAIMENPGCFYQKKVGIILTGGNVDLDHLPFGCY
ncbi:pyridoxal-phosphate dependent enzyme [Marinilabiliaceae bacterium JC017]|nr:pyridoxal-phosphate dependent enzyme [Marinilabiliaceae bacterium JC017]